MQKPTASLMAVGLLLLAACGTDDEVEPGPITSFDDIAGTTYERQGAGGVAYVHFFEDGTWHGSSNRDLVEDSPSVISETRFEGTKIFMTETKGFCSANPEAIYEIHLLEKGNLQFVEIEGVGCDDDPDATYEIHLLEDGNLQLVIIEDKCGIRSGFYAAEWAPVP